MSEVEQLRSDVKSLQEMMARLMTQMAGNSGNLSLSMASGQSDKNTSETEEETEHDNIEVKKAEATKKADEQKKKMTPLDLLKINQACELKVTDTLKLKSDKPSDVLSYKVEVENYLRSVGVLFAIDDNEIDGANPFLMIESEVRGKVMRFLLDSWQIGRAHV